MVGFTIAVLLLQKRKTMLKYNLFYCCVFLFPLFLQAQPLISIEPRVSYTNYSIYWIDSIGKNKEAYPQNRLGGFLPGLEIEMAHPIGKSLYYTYGVGYRAMAQVTNNSSGGWVHDDSLGSIPINLIRHYRRYQYISLKSGLRYKYRKFNISLNFFASYLLEHRVKSHWYQNDWIVATTNDKYNFSKQPSVRDFRFWNFGADIGISYSILTWLRAGVYYSNSFNAFTYWNHNCFACLPGHIHKEQYRLFHQVLSLSIAVDLHIQSPKRKFSRP